MPSGIGASSAGEVCDHQQCINLSLDRISTRVAKVLTTVRVILVLFAIPMVLGLSMGICGMFQA